MSSSQLNIIIPFATVCAYTALLLYLFVRRNRHVPNVHWLLGLITVSALWQLLQIVFPRGSTFDNYPNLALLIATLLLGQTTVTFLDHNRPVWRIIAIASIVGAFALDLIFPGVTIPQLEAVGLPNSVGTLLFVAAWAGLTIWLWLITWQQYQAARLPSYANRVFYWAVGLLAVFVGEAVELFGEGVWVVGATGRLIRFLGIVALALAVISFRTIDLRSRAQRVLAAALVAVTSAIPATAVLLIIQQFTSNFRAELIYLTTFGLVTFAFIFYQPLHESIERLVYRYLVGQEFNTSQVVRSYSQAIAPTLDVSELAQVIIGNISTLLGVQQGRLLLVTAEEDGYAVETVHSAAERATPSYSFPFDSAFIAILTSQQQPVLQYELDFNPAYRPLSDAEKAWLLEQAMELYVPIHDAGQLVGMIVLGPKSSGQVYRSNEIDLLQTLADQTVVSLQNARLYSAMGGHNEQIRLLNEDLRKQYELLAIMDKAKAEFISIASHELRTPLTQVKGYADILDSMNEENMLTREQTRTIIGHVNRATTQLENLVSAMLDASQLEVDSMQITFMPTALETILRLAVDPLMSAMRERRITLQMNGISDIPSIEIDFKRMVQAFHAVVANAVKYTPNGGRVTISAALIPNANGESDYLEVIIADTGIGIDAKYHELIFGKFFRIGDSQLHSTGNTKFMGAGPGLGLPITKGVIEAHGGRIWVESEGEDMERLPGSAFHIILPLVANKAEKSEDEAPVSSELSTASFAS